MRIAQCVWVLAMVSLLSLAQGAPSKEAAAKASSPGERTEGTSAKPAEDCVPPEASQPTIAPCIVSKSAPGGIRLNSIVQRGDSITVPVQDLKLWAATHNVHELRLVLAGHLLSTPEPSLVNLEQSYLKFELSASSKDDVEKKTWIQILNAARMQAENKVPVSIGDKGDLQPFLSNEFVELRVYPSYSWAVKWGIGLLLAVMLYLGWRTDLLRDTSGGVPALPARAPYSLGRWQMAWWFFLVVASYLYIWLITSEVNSLSTTVLGLIGISAGTGLAAVFVDQQKLADTANRKIGLQAEQATVQARIQQLTAAGPAPNSPQQVELQARQTRLGEIVTQLAQFPAVPRVPVSQGAIDLLRDGDGLSFHRFQIVVWTVVLGFIFVRSVARDLTMPDFDSTLLALMGISSGTYVGFKFPEAQK